MKKGVILFQFLLLLLGFKCVAAGNGSALMPVPEKVEWDAGRFRLDETFSIGIEGEGQRIHNYAQRVFQRLARRTAIFFKDPVVSSRLSGEPGLLIRFQRSVNLSLSMDESYRLEVNEKMILLESDTDVGAMRGLETFLQLLSADTRGFYLPYARIEDRPRFPWRGLLIDVSRHFLPVEVIKRNLDGMAMVKMNVLHWHLSDDQGFRVECHAYPRLHEQGSDGFYYTRDQIRDIIKYAEDRGIRVVPEFDIPGHSTSWLTGYPELASGAGPYRIERGWGIMDPTFDPTKKKTYKFFKKFFSEMSRLFPDDFIHIGGDEVNGKEWDANSAIQLYKKKKGLADNPALQTLFTQKIQKILARLGKRMIGWDEIYQPGLDSNAVIHSWRGKEAMIDSARHGFQSILSNGFYIDLMQSAGKHYLNDPLPEGTDLTAAQQKKILGGEATMWAELVSEETVDSRIWPRSAAIAERLWSPRSVRDVADMVQRLNFISIQLEETGLTHIKNRDMLLRRLCRGNSIDPLKTILGVVEPVEEYRRHSLGKKYTSFSPLCRVVDAAGADAREAGLFKEEISKLITNRDEDSVRPVLARLEKWMDNHAAVLALAERAPAVREIIPLSGMLSRLSEAAMQGIFLMQSGEKAKPEWSENFLSLLAEAGKPVAELEIVLIPVLKIFFDAVPGSISSEKEEKP